MNNVVCICNDQLLKIFRTIQLLFIYRLVDILFAFEIIFNDIQLVLFSAYGSIK